MGKHLRLFNAIPTRQSKIACGLLLALLALMLVIPFTTPLHRWGDTSTYYMQISSISEDFDIEYSPEDIQRALDNRFDDLPAGLFLIKTDSGHYYYGKEYSYALFAAPFYSFFGDQGILLFNVVLFWLMIFLGYLYLRRTNTDLVALGTSAAFFFISTAFVYIFWVHVEIYNMFLITAGIFFWLTYRNNNNYRYLMIAAVIFGIATVAKLPNCLIFAPIVCYELLNINRKHAFLMLALFLLPIVAFCGIFYLSTGTPTFYGGDRLYYTNTFPFTDGYDIENEAGNAAFSVDGGTSALIIDPGNLGVIPYNLFYYIFGRFTGMVWYYPFTIFAIVPIMLGLAYALAKPSTPNALSKNITKNKEKYLILLGILLNITFFVVIIGNNYLGGQHAVGNRYFYIYPAFLFLISHIDPKKVLAFSVIAAAILMPVITDPIGNSGSPQEITFSFPYKHLPVEYSQIDNLPMWKNQVRYTDYRLYGLDVNSENHGGTLTVTGHSEFLARANEKIDTFKFFLFSEIDENKVEVRLGNRSEIRTLDKDDTHIISFPAARPVYSDNRYYLYKLSISSDSGICLIPISNMIVKPYRFGTIITFGKTGTAQQYQVAGWSGPEDGFTWTDGHNAVLAVRPETIDSDLTLKIIASPYLGGGTLDQQRVTVYVNEHQIGEWLFNRPGIQEKTITIPHDMLEGEIQYIAFGLPDAVSPKDLGQSEDKRDLALAVRSMVIDC